nr:acyl-CoA dehydratase activase-related protein [uncultured Niameybacter sp.]
MIYRMGIDAGSTTLKVVVLDESDKIIYSSYDRHYSKILSKLQEEIDKIVPLIQDGPIRVAITGSAGYGLAKKTGIHFVQEVFATAYLVKEEKSGVDVVIELGGEDAKIIFLTGGMEERMNSTCAGGTGAFIDQMASLMNIDTKTLDQLSLEHKSIYPIASRCGVFAKSDIQPLLNQGASKEDICASIFQAVVSQTIIGLAGGRKIQGKVMFLGGPLYFYEGLKKCFKENLKLSDEEAIFPPNGQLFVATGCAKFSQNTKEQYTLKEFKSLLEQGNKEEVSVNRLSPLFESEEDYQTFRRRHDAYRLKKIDINTYSGKAYLGVDAGSTTTKMVLIGEQEEILFEFYASNEGNPVEIVREQLLNLYEICEGRIEICASGVTGYGEELITNAFKMDFGIVETLAHFSAAHYFEPRVSFILDIGGQDIKCFKVEGGRIQSIMLNEACSSGCGSFIETFAMQMGYDVKEFAKIALFAKNPVDLGSRCTVFMNSSVKEAQKEGASIEDVSAGLAISVVKNALYKVIRTNNIEELGEHIVVQGGTLLNDAILRSLEMELGKETVRPNISGLMGAFGVALYAKENIGEESSLISKENLLNFRHMSKMTRCKLCTNHCNLIVNYFGDKEKYISGNRCERPIGKMSEKLPNLYAFKYEKLRGMYKQEGKRKETIGLPLVLNFYELLPFWSTFFSHLGFKVALSAPSNKKIYRKGEYSIPSDTVCYPAKLTHGHIESLLEQGVDAIFYPCMSYNLNEGISDNCFNCPIVAYYPEVLKANIEGLKNKPFLMPYVDLNEEKGLIKTVYHSLKEHFEDIHLRDVKQGIKEGYKALETYRQAIREETRRAIDYAREHNKPIVVLAGRPYHIDPEINHGIDTLINQLGSVVLSEDGIYSKRYKPKVNVLNQWTYQARLYSAAYESLKSMDIDFIQLVSFGCGTDAITSDEISEILASKGRLYTQLKIDETSNLGAAKIRIRSMFAKSIGERGKEESSHA